MLPFFGFMALLPVASGEEPASTSTMAIGFLIAFFELIADALPGHPAAAAQRHHRHARRPGCCGRPGCRPPCATSSCPATCCGSSGEAIDLPFLAWLVLRWIRADAKEAAVVDARLDAEEHDDRPWWEVERRDQRGE